MGGKAHCYGMSTLGSHSIPRPDTWRSLGDLPDDRLVERARAHDFVAFEALMRRHNRRLFRVARSVLRDSDAAEDAVQETYLRAFTRLDTYQPTGKFGAWLTRVALNEALMIRRRVHGEMISLDDVGDDSLVAEEAATADAPSADQFVEAAYARALLEHAIDALPENFRMVFVLRAVEGLDVRETAESLGINAATVRTRLFRAQRLLRGELSQRLQTESSTVFDFGAQRCDAVVAGVFARFTA
jgi:RNA polymerase sigma-70 factor (ECF subfamily)